MEKRIKFDILIPSDILEIAKVFKNNGFKLFVVGGAVRDALLNQTPKDFDLATDAVPDMVEEMMNASGFITIATGKAFGVINVFTESGEFEIATFRSDSKESDGRRPDSVTFTTIESDVLRRDLTINALFFDLDTSEVVDMVGGVEDLKNGVIRTVGDASERFEEDRLRILRAIRFAGRFGSELDPSVDAALTKDSSLDGISGERIRDEFLKGFKSAKSVVSFLEMVDKYFLFDWIFKDLSVDKRFVEIKDPMIVISKMLRHNQTDFLSKKLNNLKYSVDETRDIVFLVKFLSLSVENAVTLKKLHNISNITNEQLLLLTQNESINAELVAAFIKFNLSVSGEDVMSNLGIKAGPEVGKAIQKAETENFVTLLK